MQPFSEHLASDEGFFGTGFWLDEEAVRKEQAALKASYEHESSKGAKAKSHNPMVSNAKELISGVSWSPKKLTLPGK